MRLAHTPYTMIYLVCYLIIVVHISHYLLGALTVAYQSPRHVSMKRDDVAIPIYCVASRHTLDITYRWQCGGSEIGANSPVFWVWRPGTYSCTVTKGLRICLSTLITVKGENPQFLTIVFAYV